MKFSKYNIVYKKNKHYLIFNTFKCSSIVLDAQGYKNFKKLNFTQDEKNALLDMNILVEEDIDETELFLTKTRMATSNSNNLMFRIYTTLGCNARCFYCYQNGLEKQTMSLEIADKVCEYILNKITVEKKLILEWFGGEPLCNHKIISYITSKLKPILQKKKISLTSNMVSNGYLFDKEMIQTAKNVWNLNRIKITLDGLHEEYEKIKQFGDKDSFERVISNIKELANNKINVVIRINYSEHNLPEIFKLLDFLAKEFKDNKYIVVYGHAIFGKVSDMNISDNTKLDIKFFKKMHEIGLAKDMLENLTANTSRCMAYALKSALIYPDGTLYKCPQEVGNSKFSIGHINQRKTNDLIYKWCSPYLPHKCIECKFLPMCNGGCTYVRRNNQKPCAITKELLIEKIDIAMDNFLKNKAEYDKL